MKDPHLFAIVIAIVPRNFSANNDSVHGIVGPFEDTGETYAWADSFRKTAVRKRRTDITALPLSLLGIITKDLNSLESLPSRDPEEILTEAQRRTFNFE